MATIADWHAWLHTAVLVAEIWLVAGLVWLALHPGEGVGRILGTTGLNIATRVVGLLPAAIAMGFIASGLNGLLPGLA